MWYAALNHLYKVNLNTSQAFDLGDTGYRCWGGFAFVGEKLYMSTTNGY
jgi:hypothetical protein